MTTFGLKMKHIRSMEMTVEDFRAFLEKLNVFITIKNFLVGALELHFISCSHLIFNIFLNLKTRPNHNKTNKNFKLRSKSIVLNLH